jgi:hypothetical protein
MKQQTNDIRKIDLIILILFAIVMGTVSYDRAKIFTIDRDETLPTNVRTLSHDARPRS